MASYIRQCELHCGANGSDKSYFIDIVQDGMSAVVNFAYGRRNSTMNHGTKTPSPVTMSKAHAIFYKLRDEKVAKGYVVIHDTPAQGVVAPAESFVKTAPPVPEKSIASLQLANAISREEMEKIMRDPNWIMQEKKDGERRAVLMKNGMARGINRKGNEVPLPPILATELKGLPDGLYDGEQIGSRMFIFDAPSVEGGWEDRMQQVASLLSRGMFVTALPCAVTFEEKTAMLSRITADRGEGVVFKKRTSLSKAGRPNSGGDWLKFKLVETATCVVSKINDSKRSVAISVLGNDGMVDVGNVTIPPNHSYPEMGSLIEVAYLYYFENGSLFQPVFKGVRNDIEQADHHSTLKRKQEVEVAAA